MHTIQLNIQDNIYEHIMFLLKNLNSQDFKIVSDEIHSAKSEDVLMFSNHSVNLIEDWKDNSEDEIWK